MKPATSKGFFDFFEKKVVLKFGNNVSYPIFTLEAIEKIKKSKIVLKIKIQKKKIQYPKNQIELNPKNPKL